MPQEPARLVALSLSHTHSFSFLQISPAFLEHSSFSFLPGFLPSYPHLRLSFRNALLIIQDNGKWISPPICSPCILYPVYSVITLEITIAVAYFVTCILPLINSTKSVKITCFAHHSVHRACHSALQYKRLLVNIHWMSHFYISEKNIYRWYFRNCGIGIEYLKWNRIKDLWSWVFRELRGQIHCSQFLFLSLCLINNRWLGFLLHLCWHVIHVPYNEPLLKDTIQWFLV